MENIRKNITLQNQAIEKLEQERQNCALNYISNLKALSIFNEQRNNIAPEAVNDLRQGAADFNEKLINIKAEIKDRSKEHARFMQNIIDPNPAVINESNLAQAINQEASSSIADLERPQTAPSRPSAIVQLDSNHNSLNKFSK